MLMYQWNHYSRYFYSHRNNFFSRRYKIFLTSKDPSLFFVLGLQSPLHMYVQFNDGH